MQSKEKNFRYLFLDRSISFVVPLVSLLQRPLLCFYPDRGAMIRLATTIFLAVFSLWFMLAAPSLAFVPPASIPTRVTNRFGSPPYPLFLAKPKKEESFLDKAMGIFQQDGSAKKKSKQAEDKENAFQKQRAAVKSMIKDKLDAMKKAPSDISDEQQGDVDEKLLNRLRVHAEKILSDNAGALELLGGENVEMGKILSRRPSTIVVDGGRKTNGIRAFIEVNGKKRAGVSLVIGDRRGVLLLKLTVGGTTLDVKMEEGLDEDLAHGVKKLRP